jgi:hypothetical protein
MPDPKPDKTASRLCGLQSSQKMPYTEHGRPRNLYEDTVDLVCVDPLGAILSRTRSSTVVRSSFDHPDSRFFHSCRLCRISLTPGTTRRIVESGDSSAVGSSMQAHTEFASEQGGMVRACAKTGTSPESIPSFSAKTGGPRQSHVR